MAKQIENFLLLSVALLLLYSGVGGGCTPSFSSKITDAVYIYEKDSGSVPPAILAGLSELNKKGVLATTFEQDTLDGSQQVPDQYRVALEAAKKEGLPALVFSSSGRVVRVLKNPNTQEEILKVVP